MQVRGMRVEVGDVEAALRQHESIADALVIGQADTSGSERLIAYVVPRGGAPISASELQSFVKTKRPDYMVQSFNVQVSSLPLTSSGKVNRRALPVPRADQRDLNRAVVAPRDDIEQKLVHIWGNVLEVRPIGISDDFFDLGGHSLLAVRLFAQI